MAETSSKQIRCTERSGVLMYELGTLTLLCLEDGSIQILRQRVAGDKLKFEAEEGDDLLACIVAHNQLLLENGGGIHHVNHHVDSHAGPRTHERKDN